MEHFIPISASIGGFLIGVSATMLWLANGRIAGISGIVAVCGCPGQVMSHGGLRSFSG